MLWKLTWSETGRDFKNHLIILVQHPHFTNEEFKLHVTWPSSENLPESEIWRTQASKFSKILLLGWVFKFILDQDTSWLFIPKTFYIWQKQCILQSLILGNNMSIQDLQMVGSARNPTHNNCALGDVILKWCDICADSTLKYVLNTSSLQHQELCAGFCRLSWVTATGF